MIFDRSSGIILHPTSLPSKFGIGDFGKEAFDFIDFLKLSKQKLWQVLPLGPTGYADSPYQSFSAFAGNPLLISPEKLKVAGLLFEEDFEPFEEFNDDCVLYGNVISYKNMLFRKAHKRFETISDSTLKEKYDDFCSQNQTWLEHYSLFMSLKDHFGGKIWTDWDSDISKREQNAVEKYSNLLKDSINYYKFIQFIFFSQWNELKGYANSNGIKIIGDIPIFVALDSADVWSNPDLFYLDADLKPTFVAGVPPDFFSSTGQLWGNPLYRWDVLKANDYKWWIDRFRNALKLYDIIRIDHFRGFAAYWQIPYGESTAINGKWIDGPGEDLFLAIEKALGKLPIIAEDLGVITPDVVALRKKFDFPGMNILQFAFEDKNPNNKYLPHNYETNSVVYTGTHDNDTTLACYQGFSEDVHKWINKYIISDGSNENICWDFIRTAISSVSVFSIVPLQDLFNLGSGGRMNFPGTPDGNWTWRFKKDMLQNNIATRLADLTECYSR